MEEEKAAAYYDELTRKGSGAARFKQGLGFSSDVSSSAAPERGSALPSSSFLSSFVRASNSSSVKAEDTSDKHYQLQSIQNKLKKKHSGTSDADRGGKLKESERERSKEREREISRDWEREKERERSSRRRHRSRSSEKDRGADRDRRRSRSRERDRDRYRSRRRGSRSRSLSDEDGRRRKDREKGSCRDRSSSPGCRRLKKDGGGVKKEYRLAKEDKKGAVDYAKLIEGYDQMTPAEKVKAKMKLQLSETAGKDTNMGSGSGWERFDFDKDAPIDNENDEEIEGVGDDAAIVKRLGQSFRYSNVQARREQELKTAHDKAMFGAPTALSPPITLESEQEQSDDQKTDETAVMNESASNLLSEKVLAKQQGSWRDRARRKA